MGSDQNRHSGGNLRRAVRKKAKRNERGKKGDLETCHHESGAVSEKNRERPCNAEQNTELNGIKKKSIDSKNKTDLMVEKRGAGLKTPRGATTGFNLEKKKSNDK